MKREELITRMKILVECASVLFDLTASTIIKPLK